MTVRFNQHGFRDTKDLTRATTNDVFVAGDSYTFGWGVGEDERYSNLLENRFNARLYNLAVPENITGYARTVDYVQRRGAPVRNLVIGLCMQNDLCEYRNPPVNSRESHGRTLRQQIALWLRWHSALWICLSHAIQGHDSLRRFVEKIGIAKNIDQQTLKNVYSPRILEDSRDELLSFATNYNAVVLIIPSRALWVGDNIDIEKKVHETFTTMLRQAGLPLVDMRPALERTGEPTSYYFKSDPHWNTKGHALAAAALAEFFTTTEPWRSLLDPERRRAAARE